MVLSSVVNRGLKGWGEKPGVRSAYKAFGMGGGVVVIQGWKAFSCDKRFGLG